MFLTWCVCFATVAFHALKKKKMLSFVQSLVECMVKMKSWSVFVHFMHLFICKFGILHKPLKSLKQAIIIDLNYSLVCLYCYYLLFNLKEKKGMCAVIRQKINNNNNSDPYLNSRTTFNFLSVLASFFVLQHHCGRMYALSPPPFG